MQVQPHSKAHRVVGRGRKLRRESVKQGAQALFFRSLLFLNSPLLFFPCLGGLAQLQAMPLFRLFGGRKRIEPALPAQPVAHLRHKAALFALPAFRVRKAPDGGSDFIQGRKLTAPQELEPG